MAVLTFSAGAIGLAAGIVIRIRRDGQETTIEVPAGSTARVGAEGNVKVVLPGRTDAAPAIEPKSASRAPGQGDLSKNILINAGAETGDEAPDAWEPGATIEGVRYSWDRNVAFDGKASLCIEKTAKRYFPIAQWSQTVPRKGDLLALEVATQVKARKMTKAIVDVIFYDKDGQWISHKWAAYIGAKREGDPPADHDWRKYSGRVDIPPETAEVCIALQVYGPGQIWFDCMEARCAK